MKEKSVLQFALARGIGEVAIKNAIAFLKNRKLTWDDFVNNRELLLEFGLKEQIIENLASSKKQADILFEKIASRGISLLTEDENYYPEYLKKMLGEKCPSMIFATGKIELLNNASVGFCGSRKASAKGIDIAYDCAKQLSEEGVTIVSGYAAGTDIAAHKAALENNGSTVFVLAEGILKATKKSEIKDLLNDSNHVFISQFMPNITWNVGNAMRRNSVIIGLSHAMILVEAGKTGGTFAAGEEALRVGCPLFVIDFAQPEVSAEANPYFIAAGGMRIRGKNGVPNISKVLNAIKSNSRLVEHTTDNAEQLRINI